MLEWLTPAERRGAAFLLVIVVLGAANDLWRSRPPVAARPARDPRGAEPLARSLPAAPADSGALAREAEPRLDLNHASAAELERLPGIGPVLAERIVAQRGIQGRFRRIEELLGVRGVGPKLFARLRPRLEIGDAQRSIGARGPERRMGRRDVHSAVPPDGRRADSASVGTSAAR